MDGQSGLWHQNRLQEFQDNWQRPFQAAFSDKVCIDEARLYMGEWAAAFGRQEAIHSGEFMGIEPTHKEVEIRYMDFWKVVNGKIVDNYVMVDFPHVLAQLGVDCFHGEGWEAFDEGSRSPPALMDAIHEEYPLSTKATIKTLCSALYNFDKQAVQQALHDLLDPDAVCQFSHPLGDVSGEALYDEVFAPLLSAFPDVERRDIICVSGTDPGGRSGSGVPDIMLAGLCLPFMDIPPTGHIAHIRYHEFFWFSAGTIHRNSGDLGSA